MLPAALMASPVASRSTEDLWNLSMLPYGSGESLSSTSSGQSAGAAVASISRTNEDGSGMNMRPSQSYSHIPPADSGHIHDPAPRPSLPLSSLDFVPPAHYSRGEDANKPVMQHGLFSIGPETLVHRHPLSSTENVTSISVVESGCGHLADVVGQDGRVDVGQNLSSYSPVWSSSTAQATNRLKMVTSEVRYQVDPSGSDDELTSGASKPTYHSAAHVKVRAPKERDGKLVPVMPGTLQKPLSNPGMTSVKSSVYISPQQAWVSSPQMPTTYISSLTSSCECLPSVSAGNEAARPPLFSFSSATAASPVPPSHENTSATTTSPRPSSDIDSPEYINGTKCICLFTYLFICHTIGSDIHTHRYRLKYTKMQDGQTVVYKIIREKRAMFR